MPSPRAPLIGNSTPSSTGFGVESGAMGSEVEDVAVSFTMRTIDALAEITNWKIKSKADHEIEITCSMTD